jgi:hypothetical protein
MKPAVGTMIRVRLCPSAEVEEAKVVAELTFDGRPGFVVGARDGHNYFFADIEEGIAWWPGLGVRS